MQSRMFARGPEPAARARSSACTLSPSAIVWPGAHYAPSMPMPLTGRRVSPRGLPPRWYRRTTNARAMGRVLAGTVSRSKVCAASCDPEPRIADFDDAACGVPAHGESLRRVGSAASAAARARSFARGGEDGSPIRCRSDAWPAGLARAPIHGSGRVDHGHCSADVPSSRGRHHRRVVGIRADHRTHWRNSDR